ncbi:MAG: D-amino acid aminotransferase [Verrucomicrobiae bacterium]|nr:D-amino acid aminotransferase [Verrucomicrobiae bacterium]
MPEIACVNGAFLPLQEAKVSVEDRGYQFADAVYEVIRTYRGRPFALDEHIARLFRSLAGIQLELPRAPDELKALVHELIRRAGFEETLIYLQVSRGVAPRHRGFPDRCDPMLVMTARAMPDTRALRERGVSVITLPDTRWARCDIKSVALLANVLAYRAAKQAGADDAIFIGQDDTVYEATAANIFIVSRGELLTPPEGPKILSGITRAKILEVARAIGLPSTERRVTKTELLEAEEAFLSSTTTEVLPIRAVDGRALGTGPVATLLYEQFARRFAL